MKRLLLALSIALLVMVSPAPIRAEYGGDGNGGEQVTMCAAQIGDNRCHANAEPNKRYCTTHRDWADHDLDWWWILFYLSL